MVAPLAVAGGVLVAITVGSVIYCCCWRTSSSLSRQGKDDNRVTPRGSIADFFKGRSNSYQEGYLRSRRENQGRGNEIAGDL